MQPKVQKRVIYLWVEVLKIYTGSRKSDRKPQGPESLSKLTLFEACLITFVTALEHNKVFVICGVALEVMFRTFLEKLLNEKTISKMNKK